MGRYLNNKNKKDSGEKLLISYDVGIDNQLGGHFTNKGSYTIITGNTGSAKTKFTKAITVHAALKYKQAGNKCKILWFALEESKEEFWDGLVSAELAKLGLHYSPMELLNFTNTEIPLAHIMLAEEILDNICEKYDFLEIITHLSHPYGIYNHIREYMHIIGQDVKEHKIIDEKQIEVVTGYNKNENVTVFAVIDHLTFVSSENGKTKWDSFSHFSKEYLSRQLKDRFGVNVILVQQQASETEREEFWQGKTIATKLYPSLNGLSEYKNTQQEATLVLGLFSPSKYEIEKIGGFDITKLKDKFRVVTVLKDRYFGLLGTKMPFYFNGATNEFKYMTMALYETTLKNLTK